MYLELKDICKRYADAKPGEPDAVSHVDLEIKTSSSRFSVLQEAERPRFYE